MANIDTTDNIQICGSEIEKVSNYERDKPIAMENRTKQEVSMRSEASKCCSCLPNPLIGLSVQGEVASDSEAKICELFNDIKLIVIDRDGWQLYCILPQDVCLLQTDG